jgi:hypothetical protein
MDVCKTKETGSWRRRSTKPARRKDKDAEQDDGILKHYTKRSKGSKNQVLISDSRI